jgi:hypothetical protein
MSKSQLHNLSLIVSGRFAVHWFPETGLQHNQFYAYAEVYKESLITLINEITRNHDLFGNEKDRDNHPATLSEHDYGIIPAVFLFRHYIELQLKGMILQRGGTMNDFNRRHGLDVLLQLLVNRIDLPAISENTRQFIRDLAELDSNSQGFRYPYTRGGQRFFEDLLEEKMTQVNTLREFMNRATVVIDDLENQEGRFDSEDEARNDND